MLESGSTVSWLEFFTYSLSETTDHNFKFKVIHKLGNAQKQLQFCVAFLD